VKSVAGRPILALCALAALESACGGRVERPTPSPSPAASAAAATNGPSNQAPITFVAPRTGDKYIYLTKQQRNRKVYVLRADAEKGQYFGENTGRSSFVNPHITFYGSEGKQVVADAPYGLVIEGAKTVQMTGGAHARSQDGVTLKSDEMLYNDTLQTIHAQGNVVMDSPQGSELRGASLDWNLTTGAVDVTGAR
jgi:LPS export ABC transporter protein LptC